MFELNGFTAVPVGALTAAAWGAVGIRRTLRSGRFAGLSKNQRLGIWAVAAVAFAPALFLSFLGAVMLAVANARPGAATGLVNALVVALGMGFFGAALTWAAGLLATALIHRRRVQREHAV